MPVNGNGNPNRFSPCRGPSRRDLLRTGLYGTLGFGFADLLQLRALAGTASKARVKNCILVWLAGGASHIDTFDPKPDAPVDVRGEFKPIDTSVPSLKISEVFPQLAKVLDRACLIPHVTKTA